MRITPIILFVIGIWGLIYPETLLDPEGNGGRWVFVIIIALGAFALWRSLSKRRQ